MLPPVSAEQLVTKGLDWMKSATEMPATSAIEAQVSPELAVTVSAQESVP